MIRNFLLRKRSTKSVNFWLKTEDRFSRRNRYWEAVFGFDNESNDSTIITHIKNIRAKFADYDYTPIKTVWGIGYKWEE